MALSSNFIKSVQVCPFFEQKRRRLITHTLMLKVLSSERLKKQKKSMLEDKKLDLSEEEMKNIVAGVRPNKVSNAKNFLCEKGTAFNGKPW
jgi:hypothetical protein